MGRPIVRVLALVGFLWPLVACGGGAQQPATFARTQSKAILRSLVLPVADRAAPTFRYGVARGGAVTLLRRTSRKFHNSNVFVGDQLNDAVYVSNAVNGVPLGTIQTTLPVWGLATDPATGNVYVGLGEMGASNGEVLILNSSGTEQLGSLTDSSCCGYALTVQSGQLYVANWTGACGPTTIDVFTTAQTSGTPVSTVTEPNQLVYGLSSDGQNLFAQGFNLDCSATVIDQSSNAGQSWSRNAQSGISAYPGGLANAANGLFFIDDQNGQLYEYQNGTKIAQQGYIDLSTQNPLDYTGLAIGLYADIWAANVNYGCGQAMCSDGQGQLINELSYLTFSTVNRSAESLGITVSPAAGQ